MPNIPPNNPSTELVPYQRNSKKGILPILLAILLVGALTGVTWFLTRDKGAANEQQSVIVVTPGGCDKKLVATQAMISQGFQPDEFVVGDQINWNAPVANERGAAAFAFKTPVTAKALVEELRSDTDKANAALKALMDESGSTRRQLLTSRNWIPVQFRVESSWDGNTAFSNGHAVSAGTRRSAAGDIVWLFVNQSKCKPGVSVVSIVTAHRAGCGNPQTALPRPARPVSPTPPTGEIGKDHRLSPPTTLVVHCPPGQFLDRYTEKCKSPSETTTTTTDGQGDSGDGATNTVPPPTTVAPPPAPPTTAPPTVPPPTPPTIPSL